MAGPMMFDYFGDSQRAFQDAREQKRKSTLEGLAGRVYGGEGATPQLMGDFARNGGNPEPMLKFEQGQEEVKQARVGRIAGLIAAAPGPMRAQLYAAHRGELESVGLQGLPDQWDDSLLPVAQQLAGGKGEQERWFNAGNGMLASTSGQSKAIDGYQPDQEKSSWGYIPDPSNPENEVYAERRGREFYAIDGRSLYGGGGQVPQRAPAHPQGASGDVMDRLRAMEAQFPGATMTSGLRTPEHNRKVGGVPNSQHLRGTAADYVVPPQDKSRFINQAEGAGFQVIDEGDHLHTQLPNRGRSPNAPSGQIPGSRPRYKAGAEGGQYRSMSPDEVSKAGLPAGTVAQVSPSGQIQIVNKPRDIPGGQSQVIDNADGTQTIIPAGKTTEDQNKSAGYAVRMEKALKDIGRYTTDEPDANRPGVGTALLDMLPDSVGNYGKSEGRQNVEAAQLDALDAALTLNTGAAYTKEQLRSLAKAYFPQPGNSAGVVKEKADRLQSLIQTARLRARGALPQNSAAKPTVADANAKIGPMGGSVWTRDASGKLVRGK